MAPITKTLGPITSTTVKLLLTGEFIHGTPMCIQDIMVTMRDGVKVAVDVHFPRQVYRGRQKCPTILIRTPYSKSQIPVIAHHFVQNGFVVVFQDVRGTSHSNKTGVNTIFILEREDAQDIIAWIKKQFWWNGKLGTWGASYLGLTQWAVYDNEDISTFYVQVSSPRNLWVQHNGLGINELAVAFSRIVCDGACFYGPMLQGKQERFHYWQYGQHYIRDPAKGLFNMPPGVEKVSLDDLAKVKKKEMVSIVNAVFGLDLHTSNPDPKIIQRLAMDLVFGKKISRFADFLPGYLDLDYSKIKRPFLIVGGWYDMFIRKSLEDYCAIMANASSDARKYTKMIIGPWGHGAVRHPDVKNILHGGMLDLVKNIVNVDWFNYWLKEDSPARRRIEKQLINTPPLQIFTLGESKWRWEHEWPLARTEYRNLYLHSSGTANSLNGDGHASFEEPADEQPDVYLHDPANPVLSEGGNNLYIMKGAFDQHKMESRDDVLVYTSEKLTEGIEVTGNIKCELHAASTAVDTDFMVHLCDVYPDGKSYNIDDLGIRARFRDGTLSPPSLIEPGTIYKYEFELWPTSVYFKPGHRIRIDISSSDFPKYNVHSNLANGNAGEYTIAKQAIYHDKDHPSCLVLPIIPRRGS